MEYETFDFRGEEGGKTRHSADFKHIFPPRFSIFPNRNHISKKRNRRKLIDWTESDIISSYPLQHISVIKDFRPVTLNIPQPWDPYITRQPTHYNGVVEVIEIVTVSAGNFPEFHTDLRTYDPYYFIPLFRKTAFKNFTAFFKGTVCEQDVELPDFTMCKYEINLYSYIYFVIHFLKTGFPKNKKWEYFLRFEFLRWKNNFLPSHLAI